MEKTKQFKLFKVLFLFVVFMFVLVVSSGCDLPGEDPVEYTVTFKVDGATLSTQTVETVSELQVPADPTKAGFTFLHWALEGATTEYNLASELTANIVLVAIFEEDVVTPETFTVTFVVEGEDNVTVDVEDGDLVARPATDPTKAGYTFSGWFVGEAGSEVEYNFSTPVTANITITAIFEVIATVTYTVTFNVDGSATTSIVNDGDTVSVPTAPTKAGHVFVEWQLDGSAYNFATPVTADITLTALFAVAVTVTFQIDGSPVLEVIAINTAVSQPADPFKAGFLFDDWYVGTEVYDFATLVTENITITAQFVAAASYTITYELDGGTNNASNPATKLNDTALVLAAPTKDGNAFVGWYGNAEFTGDAITQIAAGNIEDITVYAKWDSSANATYTLNGGSITTADMIELRESTYIQTARYITMDWNGYSIMTGIAPAGAHWYVMGFKTTATAGVYELVGKGVGYSNASATLYISYHDFCTSSYKDDLVSVYDTAAVGSLIVVTGLPSAASTTANIEIYFMAATAATADVTAKLQPSDEMLTPVREGYIFLGWCEESDLSDTPITVYPGNAGGTDITYYAKWAVANTVTYELDGGTNATANPTFIAAEILPIDLADATKVGYTFDGWFTEATFENEVTQITVAADVTLYAKFTVTDYNITYVLDEGTNDSANPATYNINTATITLADATKDDYRFLGWFTEDTFVTEVTQIASGSTGDKTLYAKWELITDYNVTYVLDGGTNDSANPATFVNEDLPVALAAATKDGYTFDGWYTEAEFTNVVTSITVAADTTLYAKFTIIDYDITYVLDEGTNNVANPATYTITTATITLADPTKANYMFKGWFLEATFENAVTEIELGSTGNITVYAKWELIVTYTITYNLDDGTNNVANPATHANDTVLTLADPTKDGYNFDGWFDNVGLTGTPVTSIPVSNTDNIELWAAWIVPFTVTYDLDGGHWTYASREALAADFLADYLEFYNSTASIPISVVTLLISDDSGYDASTAFVSRNSTDAGDLGVFFNHANYKDKWMWVIEYLRDIAVAGPNDYDLIINNTFTARSGSVRWETRAFFAGDGRGAIPVADYGNPTIGDAFWAETFADTSFLYQNSLRTLPTPYKDAYTFEGWYDNDTFTGSPVTSANAATTLYAKWATVEYDITYNLDGGDNNASNPATFNIETTTITLEPATKVDYTFLGWYDNASFTGTAITEIALGSSGDITLYARFISNNLFIVTYDLGDSVDYADKTAMATAFVTDYGTYVSKTITIAGFYDDSYPATGTTPLIDFFNDAVYGPKWSWMMDYIVDVATEQSYASLANITTTPNISFFRCNVASFLNNTVRTSWPISADFTAADDNSGFWGVYISGTVEYDGAPSTLPTPVKDGYTFDGWYSEATFENLVTTISTQIVTLYAKFTAIPE